MPGLRLRVLKARHERCGTETQVQIPRALSRQAVRRVRCEQCGERFDAQPVTEVGRWFDPSSRTWQLASLPVAGLLVVGGLLIFQGDDGGGGTATPPSVEAPAADTQEPSAPLSEAPSKPDRGNAGGSAAGRAGAEFVRGAHYSLALPKGWEKVDPPAGATFAAVAAGGDAEATLWIEEDADLDFSAFVTQSLNQLETLAPNPRVVERVPGPTLETTVVRLAADAPAGQPQYSVLLRAAGPYRYYLALTIQPDAGREAADGLDLIAGSLTPEVSG